jgi:hypothetical protein
METQCFLLWDQPRWSLISSGISAQSLGPFSPLMIAALWASEKWTEAIAIHVSITGMKLLWFGVPEA